MKFNKPFILLAGLATVLWSCNPNNKEQKQINATTHVAAVSQPSSVSDTQNGEKNSIGLEREFIRTADLKFKVKDVAKATADIESITHNLGGFVSYSDLKSTIENKNTVQVSEDSVLETTHYSVSNQMKLRVPNQQLDTVLKSVTTLVDYLDFRLIKADDVALQLLSNKLTQQRAAAHKQRMEGAINSHSAKLSDKTNAEEMLYDKLGKADDSKIANLSLKDKIDYSTISLYLYQRSEAKNEMILGGKHIDPYTPAFTKRVADALNDGWKVMEAIIIFISKVWVIILLGLLGYYAWKGFKIKVGGNI